MPPLFRSSPNHSLAPTNGLSWVFSDIRTRCRHQHKRTAFPHNLHRRQKVWYFSFRSKYKRHVSNFLHRRQGCLVKKEQLFLWSVVNHEVNMPSHPSPCIMLRRIVRHFSLANQLRVKCVPSVCLCRTCLCFLCFYFSCLADCIPSIMLNWRECSLHSVSCLNKRQGVVSAEVSLVVDESGEQCAVHLLHMNVM